MVDPDPWLAVVKAPNGFLFDMVVTSKTMIEPGYQAITLKDLPGA
jgi:hypothetical protein